jgi:hypothetical protein
MGKRGRKDCRGILIARVSKRHGKDRFLIEFDGF